MNEEKLGEFLRHEREQRGISIEQVASATKINIRLLHALEEDQFSDLPAKPFIRGFVSSYSRFVGIDSKDILSRYDHYIEDKCRERPTREGGHSGYAFDKRDSERSRTMLWAVMGSLIAFGGILIFILKPALKHRRISHVDQLRGAAQQQQPAATSAPAAASSVPKAPATAVATPATVPAAEPQLPTAVAPAKTIASAEPPKPASAVQGQEEEDLAQTGVDGGSANEKDPLNKGDDLAPVDVKTKVVFKALANIWVRYQVDDKEVTKFMLLKDRYLVLKAKNLARFQVSNENAVLYRYGDWQYKPLKNLKQLSMQAETPTVVFPFEAASGAAPFGGLAPLPRTPDPESDLKKTADSTSNAPSPATPGPQT